MTREIDKTKQQISLLMSQGHNWEGGGDVTDPGIRVNTDRNFGTWSAYLYCGFGDGRECEVSAKNEPDMWRRFCLALNLFYRDYRTYRAYKNELKGQTEAAWCHYYKNILGKRIKNGVQLVERKIDRTEEVLLKRWQPRHDSRIPCLKRDLAWLPNRVVLLDHQIMELRFCCRLNNVKAALAVLKQHVKREKYDWMLMVLDDQIKRDKSKKMKWVLFNAYCWPTEYRKLYCELELTSKIPKRKHNV